MAENEYVGNLGRIDGRQAVYQALGLEEDGGRSGLEDSGIAFSNLKLDHLAARFDSWQNDLATIADDHGFDLAEVDGPVDGEEAAELFGSDGDAVEDMSEFLETLDDIEAATQACRELGIDAVQEQEGWFIRFDGRERGRGRGQKAGEYGFDPEHEHAAWLVYDQAGRPGYIATARFLVEDIEGFEGEHWEYRQSSFNDEGVVDLSSPDVQISGDALADIVDALEAVSLIPEEDKPRAEAIEYSKALQMEQDSARRAAGRLRDEPELDRARLAETGFYGPAAAHKHEQAGSTVIFDRSIVPAGGDEKQGFHWTSTRIPAFGIAGDEWEPAVTEGDISPRGLSGDELHDWQAMHPDAYTVALRLAAGDSGRVPTFTGEELAQRAIELAPRRVSPDDMRKGAQGITAALGAAEMTRQQAHDVLEAFAHAQVATDSVEIRHEAVRFAAGKGYEGLIAEAHGFDGTWEGDPGLPFSWVPGDEAASLVLAPLSDTTSLPNASVRPSFDEETRSLAGWTATVASGPEGREETRAFDGLPGAVHHAVNSIACACDADMTYDAFYLCAFMSAGKALDTAVDASRLEKLGVHASGPAVLAGRLLTPAEAIGAAATRSPELASLAAAAYDLAGTAARDLEAANFSLAMRTSRPQQATLLRRRKQGRRHLARPARTRSPRSHPTRTRTPRSGRSRR